MNFSIFANHYFHFFNLSDGGKDQLSDIKSNQITFIVTSPQHKCLGE